MHSINYLVLSEINLCHHKISSLCVFNLVEKDEVIFVLLGSDFFFLITSRLFHFYFRFFLSFAIFTAEVFSVDNLWEEEKETFLLIQRVKIGEAIAKANKNLGMHTHIFMSFNMFWHII